MERCGLNFNMLEMEDCKHFIYNEIKKGIIKVNLKILQVVNFQVGVGRISDCQKYCLLHETE